MVATLLQAAGCSEFSKDRELPDDIVYSYACLDSTAANNKVVDALRRGEDLVRKYGMRNIEVTDEEQSNLGDEMLAEVQKTGEIELAPDTDTLTARLRTILSELLGKRSKPSGIRYAVHLIDDKETVNAFTFGGQIFVTRAIVARCTSDDQLYAIVGHEIGHNERGHIRKTVQDLKAAELLFGENGEFAYSIKRLLTASFNQRDEIEADYYGLDLVYMLGRQPCPIVDFWRNMAGDEQKDELLDFLRSHPYSAARGNCLADHVAQNFDASCATP